MNNNKPTKTPEQKRELFWVLMLLIVIPIVGVILGIIAGVTENYILMLIALPMMLTFFVATGVLFFQGYKENKKNEKEEPKEEPDSEYDDYKGNLNLSDKMILDSDKNPYTKSAIKGVAIIAMSILVPTLLSYLLRNSEIMIGDLYVKNILKGGALLLGIVSIGNQWKNICEYLDFNRAKKVLKAKANGKKPGFLLPRMSVITLLFLVLLVMIFGIQFKDINTLNAYKQDGVEVNAVIYKIETDGEDSDVYFQYDYEGNTYSYMHSSYPGAKRVGNEVTAYIYPDNPDELFIYYSSAFAVYIMLGFFCFFWLMDNGFKSGVKDLCLLLTSAITIILGVGSGAAVHIIFGVIVLLFTVWRWVK